MRFATNAVLALLQIFRCSNNNVAAGFVLPLRNTNIPPNKKQPDPERELARLKLPCNARDMIALASAASSTATDSTESFAHIENLILEAMQQNAEKSKEYSDMFGLGQSEAAFFAVFDAIRKSGIPLGLKGSPFVLKSDDVTKALAMDDNPFVGFFGMDDLEKALEDDFLDAARGSTDNRKGWKITAVSNPRGDSFEEARMTFDDVQTALEKGTVIFNAAGAHIPKLAGPTLACTDATCTPNAMNIYITAAGKRTSAPPHTDKQDVVVVQTSGRKHWKVYAPPDPAREPMSDVFARGKGDDSLPLYRLDEEGTLLLETTLEEGDILFIPAAFPHTTSTALDASAQDDCSVHLTFNIDTHVWDLDYLSIRRLALRRACVKDAALGQSREKDNRYVGRVNQLPQPVHSDLMSELPFDFLDEESTDKDAAVDAVTKKAFEIAERVDEESAALVDSKTWKDTVGKIREQGVEMLEIHRDMYLAALEEGRVREAEDAMTEHLPGKRRAMTQERMQRLSLFRVQRYYEKINEAKAKLQTWSLEGTPTGASTHTKPLPDNWAFTMPLKVGDQVEADLGGAFFPATVTRAAGSSYDVQFFDGDKESGLDRGMLKLLAPPNLAEEEVDTSSMTPKQLKRWKKQQEK
eukprot:CAMPEP_0119566390 /NCGR_PEP_ID=MMETSP1352-20130426/32920_1 /TAXON_ID=265584 /ORGANISM="Stauroneis constricta, Strain CCMP1120" /LENGTH=636 /DNA_ID=CAMNT_0007615493 /DNA_START=15 /DNA_END=1922 /DNA_ORIENTATION=+